METPFICLPCNFTTTLKANLARHEKTVKHIKICKCQEVVSTTIISVVNTETKEPIYSANNQLLDSMEDLIKKNESLEETIKKLQKTIEMMAAVVNHIVEQKMMQTLLPTLEVEKNEPVNVVIPIVSPLESVQEVVEPKKKKNKVVLIEEKKEEKKESIESSAEKEKIMRMEMEMKELKAKTTDNPIDLIEETHKYMAQEVQQNKRKKILEIDTIYGLCENISMEYLPNKTSLNHEENLPDFTNEYVNLVIKFLKNELSKVDENKRPLVYHKKQLYIRKIVSTEGDLKYQWVQSEINDFISLVVETFYMFYLKLNIDNEAMTHFMNHDIKQEKDQKKILTAIMPLILMK